MEIANPVISRETLIQDYQAATQGKFEQDQVDAAIEAMQAVTKSYTVTGRIESFVVYIHVEVTVAGGKTFDGDAGGLCSPGAGLLVGDLYTDDLDRLYRDTVSFMVTPGAVYLAVYFYDSHSNLLGHVQAAALSFLAGIAGGTGHWH